MELHWREAGLADLPRISEIADKVHATLPERPEVFAEKISLSPQTSLVLQAGSEIAGYGIAHPWISHQIPLLDAFLAALPQHPNCIYIHDVAVLPELRGKNALNLYIAKIAKLAATKQIQRLALVSVYGTAPLWRRSGFQEVDNYPELNVKLQSYGEGAKYMLCDLKR